MALDQETQDNRIVRAARHFGQQFDSYTAEDIGPALTCSESDALSELLNALGLQDVAEVLEMSHARSDDEGDTHGEGDDE